MGTAVRLQYEADLPAGVLTTLVDELELAPDDLYPDEGFTAFSDLFQLYAAVELPRLKDRPLPPHPVPAFESAPDIWSAIRAGDILVCPPVPLLRRGHPLRPGGGGRPEGAGDQDDALPGEPHLAHRPGPHARGGERQGGGGAGELQARFDEEANIRWARALEEVGAHVVYGLVGYKTHGKACLVVRQEADGIRRYCHLGTGQLQRADRRRSTPTSGCSPAGTSFGEDLTELFNLLTGYTRPHGFQHLLVAPPDCATASSAASGGRPSTRARGRPARIIAKMNSLVDEHAHRGAVRGEPGRRRDRPDRARHLLPAPRRARAVGADPRRLDRRPLPRARARLLLRERRRSPSTSSPPADWMPRNLDHRVETAFPVLDPRLQAQMRDVLEIQLADTVKAWPLLPDGRSDAGPGGAGAPLAGAPLRPAGAAGGRTSGLSDRHPGPRRPGGATRSRPR